MHPAHNSVEQLFREHHGRVLATLIHQLGDITLAEDALQEAFESALATWPVRGVPDSPIAWITATARRKAIDRLRRDVTLAGKQAALQALAQLGRPDPYGPPGEVAVSSVIPDERLRLIFTCCHPALALDARIALTLR